MPLIMVVSLKIYPHLLYCFQTNNEGQVTAWLKQENTVCTPGGKHRYQMNCTIVPISSSQETHLGVAHGGAGADKAEYTTEERRIYSYGTWLCELKSDVGSWYHCRTPATRSCATWKCTNAEMPAFLQTDNTEAQSMRCIRVPDMRKPDIQKSVQFSDALLHCFSLLCFVFSSLSFLYPQIYFQTNYCTKAPVSVLILEIKQEYPG